ncbi:hypothetical protein BH11BAC4_BH11BAC4_07750 [soil metagenome]
MITESSIADKQFFKARGAGAFPKAAAVLSDIAALRYDYRCEDKKLQAASGIKLTNDYYLTVYIGAADIIKIVTDDLEWIEECRNDLHCSSAVAVTHAEKLFNNNWWKQNAVSLILLPEPIIENIDDQLMRKKTGIGCCQLISPDPPLFL